MKWITFSGVLLLLRLHISTSRFMMWVKNLLIVQDYMYDFDFPFVKRQMGCSRTYDRHPTQLSKETAVWIKVVYASSKFSLKFCKISLKLLKYQKPHKSNLNDLASEKIGHKTAAVCLMDCVNVSPRLPAHPTTHTLCPHSGSPHLGLYDSLANRLICTIFSRFYSMNMW